MITSIDDIISKDDINRVIKTKNYIIIIKEDSVDKTIRELIINNVKQEYIDYEELKL